MAGLTESDVENGHSQSAKSSVKANNAKLNDSDIVEEPPSVQSANTRQRARLKETVERVIQSACADQAVAVDISRKQLTFVPKELLEIKSLKVRVTLNETF